MEDSFEGGLLGVKDAGCPLVSHGGPSSALLNRNSYMLCESPNHNIP